MRIDIVSLFPQMIEDASGYGVTGKAIDQGIVELGVWNPRDFSRDKRRTVDDHSYGGGPGMVLMLQPMRDAIREARRIDNRQARVVYLSPQGRRLKQSDLLRYSNFERLILVAGRYEGIDERIAETEIDEECSLGDYVISGGELAALIVIDGITRLLPGVLGKQESCLQDSFMNGLLDHPHYTRPETFDGLNVPDVLTSGDHSAIERWRMKQALGRTYRRRPDLLDQLKLNVEQQRLLAEFINEDSKKEE